MNTTNWAYVFVISSLLTVVVLIGVSNRPIQLVPVAQSTLADSHSTPAVDDFLVALPLVARNAGALEQPTPTIEPSATPSRTSTPGSTATWTPSPTLTATLTPGEPGGTVIDFATQDPDLLIAGDVANGSLGTDMAVGDLDGDGVDDLIIGAPWAHRAADERFAGHVYIFLGGQDRPALVSGDNADVTIVGAAAGDAIGGGVDRRSGTIATGDLNGDEFDDLVLGAPDARDGAGEVRVVFGRSRSDWRMASPVDLASGSDVVIISADANDALGSAVTVGDISGDGMGDLIVGAMRADGLRNARTNAGEVHVFWGRSLWPATSLAADDADLRVVGRATTGFLGSGLAVGQLGGTGVVDVAIGAIGAAGPEGDRTLSGGVYVLFGSTDLGGVRDLAATAADWVVYSADAGDALGRHLAVGDVSGDGEPDLVIGIPNGDGPGNEQTDAGEVAVFFGPRASGTNSVTDGADFFIYGPQKQTDEQPGCRFGDSLGLGDFNRDRIMDVVGGARQEFGFDGTATNAGAAFVVFGGHRPASVDLQHEDADIAIFGRDSEDYLGRVAAGNLDGSSPDDLALGAYAADVTNGEDLGKAGEVSVVYRK